MAQNIFSIQFMAQAIFWTSCMAWTVRYICKHIKD